MIGKRWAIGGLMLLAAGVLGGCQGMSQFLDQKPGARLVKARVQNMDLQQADLAFDLEVSNPYSVPLPLTRLRYALNSGESSVASGEAQPEVTTVPAKGKANLTLPLTLKYADVMRVVGGLKPGMLLPYEAKLDLIADAPGIGELPLNLSKSGELPVPAAPKVALNELKWQELSLNKASGVLDLSVTNTNQFPVDLGQLVGDLMLGGKSVATLKNESKLSLKPQQAGALRIPFEVSPSAMGMQLLGMLSGGEVSYGLNGSLSATTPAGPLTWPFASGGKAPASKGK
jgi:LEA14-like dessication related protein